MKRKITKNVWTELKKNITKNYLEDIKSWIKFIVFVTTALVVAMVVVFPTEGRGLPYFILAYLLAVYFLFGRGISLKVLPIIRMIPVIGVVLILIVAAIQMLGK